jgi:hypothetical protein
MALAQASPVFAQAQSVTITANGQEEPLVIGSNASLQIAMSGTAGANGFANPTNLYFGFIVLAPTQAVVYITPTGVSS